MNTKLTTLALIVGAVIFAFCVTVFVPKLFNKTTPVTTQYKNFINTHQSQFQVVKVLKCRSDIIPGSNVCAALGVDLTGQPVCLDLVSTKVPKGGAAILAKDSPDACLFAS